MSNYVRTAAEQARIDKAANIKDSRKRIPVKCKHCGHKDTKAEVQARCSRGYINDQPREYCSEKCQKAAWEKKNGTRRKREQRAKRVPMLIHRVAASGQSGVPMVAHGGPASGQKETQ